MKILFVAVFDDHNISTNNSQGRAFESLGHTVHRYNFREEERYRGKLGRDADLVSSVSSINPDLVVFSKCCEISLEAIKAIASSYLTCYWFMDPPSSVTPDIINKAAACDYSAIAWKGSLPAFSAAGCTSFYVPEGFDEEVDQVIPQEKRFDVSFIGSLHSNRYEMLSRLRPHVVQITNAYGANHSMAVAASKINISLSTNGGASDRVFKVLAAGGFLLTNDFVGLDEMFEDGKDLVVFDGVDDLQEKIDLYLKNETARSIISSNGHRTVQKYNRIEWAKKIVSLGEGFLESYHHS